MSDIQHEYYIRQPDDSEARGPFTLAQLASLAGDGGLDSRTLYFDAAGEQWLSVASDAELGGLLRNANARAGAGSRSRSRAKAEADAPARMFAVNAVNAVNVARVLLFASAVALLAGAVAFMAATPGGKMGALFLQPFFWLGVIDVALGACAGGLMGRGRLALVIRLRAALGFGILGVFFWLVALLPALVFVVIASACLWLATVFSNRRALSFVATAGLAALAGFAYCMV